MKREQQYVKVKDLEVAGELLMIDSRKGLIILFLSMILMNVFTLLFLQILSPGVVVLVVDIPFAILLLFMIKWTKQREASVRGRI